MEDLKNKLIELGVSEKHLYIDKKGGLFVNCADTQYISRENGVYRFNQVGGSRFFWRETFADTEECAKFIYTNIYSRTNEDINKIYRQIAGAISQ